MSPVLDMDEDKGEWDERGWGGAKVGDSAAAIYIQYAIRTFVFVPL